MPGLVRSRFADLTARERSFELYCQAADARKNPESAISGYWSRAAVRRLSVVRLFSQRFEIDLEHCPNCGEQLKIIAAILELAVVERILMHLGLQARTPPQTPARERPRMGEKTLKTC